MKHWKYGRSTNHDSGITLKLEERVICIGTTLDGAIFIVENCDGHYVAEMEREEAIEALQEAIEWIRGQGVNKVGTNFGHGHAWERPDGLKAKCGGTMVCKECQDDLELVELWRKDKS